MFDYNPLSSMFMVKALHSHAAEREEERQGQFQPRTTWRERGTRVMTAVSGLVARYSAHAEGFRAMRDAGRRSAPRRSTPTWYPSTGMPSASESGVP